MPTPTLSSRIAAVTVFRRGALVTRTATLTRTAPGFPARVRVEGLPMLLDDASLQVAIEPPQDGTAPLPAEAHVTLAVPAPDPSLRPPTDDELEAAALELAQAERARADLAAVHSSVSRLEPGPRGVPAEGEPPRPSPTQTRLAVLDFRRQRLDRLEAEMTAAATRCHAAKERFETLKERERTASTAHNPREFEARKAVVLGLHDSATATAAEVRLVLRYFVPGARWAPGYVLRLDPSLQRGVLELRAMVAQATTESWTNVALTLSTAHPQQWTELPQLRSLRIGRRQPTPARVGWRPPPTDTAQLFADYDRDLGSPAPARRRKPRRRSAPVPTPAPAPMASPEPAAEGTALLAMEDLGEIELESAAPAAAFGGPAGAPPPPPQAAAPQAPPMSLGARPSRSAKKRSGAAASIGGALERFGSGGGGPLQGVPPPAEVEEQPPAPTSIQADRALLEYGRLRLAPADDSRRGGLVSATSAQLYGQLASVDSATVDMALGRAHAAQAKARAVEQRAAPTGHAWAHAVDGFDYAYVADAPATVASDGEAHGVPLVSPTAEATARFITVPSRSPEVFRVLVLRNPIEAPLLRGPIDVYIDGRFVVASTVTVTPPRGRLELGLGVEQAIKVARNVAFDDESSGLLKRHRELEHRVRVDINNHLSTAAKVEVRERVPVPSRGEDDVEVQERTIDPAWDELEQDDPPLEGGRVWKVEVEAGGQRTLSACWSIKIPNTHEILGGNRRDQ